MTLLVYILKAIIDHAKCKKYFTDTKQQTSTVLGSIERISSTPLDNQGHRSRTPAAPHPSL